MRTFFESTSTGCFPRLLRTHSNSVNPHFFSRLQVRPRGSRKPGFPPTAAAPSSPLTPRQLFGGAAFFLPLTTQTFNSDYFCKKSRKVIVTGNTKTTKGWASEREKYRSVEVVDCRAQAVYSCGLPICFIYCWTSLVCRFFVLKKPRNGTPKWRCQRRTGEILKRNNRMLRVVLQN